jgi:pimeloyl-ACP methyl ester carboxylesterase
MTTLALDSRHEKSTTDRVFSLARSLSARSVGAALPPSLSARWAAHLFATPRTSERTDAEDLSLLTGRPFRVHGLAAWRWGSGPPVFLMHGWEGRGSQLRSFVEPLVDKGFSVVTFDAPAHGASPGTEATIADFADSLLALERHVGRPAAVIAHSLGSLATLLAVRRGLSADAVVLIAVPSPKERIAYFQSALRLPEAVTQRLMRIIEDQVGLPWTGVEGAALAKGLTVPTLVVHDRNDKEAPTRNSEATAAALSNATLELTEGLGHRRILSDARVVSEVTSFVAASTGARKAMIGS